MNKQKSNTSCEIMGKSLLSMVFRPMSFNLLGQTDVCEDSTQGNKIKVRISGRSIKLEGFPEYPEVYFAWFNGLAPEPLPLTPKVSNGFGCADKIKNAHLTVSDWPAQEKLYPALTGPGPFNIDVVVWHRYVNTFTGATHIMVEKLELRFPTGTIPACPDP